MLDNARQAVRDLNAIAYIGDRDSAATALSVPLTNEGHILQVSPSSTYDGLTRASRRQGEPDRFYPSGERTFGRVVPADHVQASALIGYMKVLGARSLALLADREIYGGGIADEVEKAAARQGITVYDRGRIDALKDDLSGPARKVAETGADAFLFAGTTDTGAAAIFKAVAAAAPRHAAVRSRRRRRPGLRRRAAGRRPAAHARDDVGAAAAPAAARGARLPRPLPHDVRPPAGARGAAGLRGRQRRPARDPGRGRAGQRPPAPSRRRSSRSAIASRCSAAIRSTASATRACRATPETVSAARSSCSTSCSRCAAEAHAARGSCESHMPGACTPATKPHNVAVNTCTIGALSVFSLTEEGSILRFKGATAALVAGARAGRRCGGVRRRRR